MVGNNVSSKVVSIFICTCSLCYDLRAIPLLIVYTVWQDVSILLVWEDVNSKFGQFITFYTKTVGRSASSKATSISAPNSEFHERWASIQRSWSRCKK